MLGYYNIGQRNNQTLHKSFWLRRCCCTLREKMEVCILFVQITSFSCIPSHRLLSYFSITQLFLLLINVLNLCNYLIVYNNNVLRRRIKCWNIFYSLIFLKKVVLCVYLIIITTKK